MAYLKGATLDFPISSVAHFGCLSEMYHVKFSCTAYEQVVI